MVAKPACFKRNGNTKIFFKKLAIPSSF